jgi:hypothetical protein
MYINSCAVAAQHNDCQRQRALSLTALKALATTSEHTVSVLLALSTDRLQLSVAAQTLQPHAVGLAQVCAGIPLLLP